MNLDMAYQQKYVIVYFVNKEYRPNEFSSLEWPLHITLLANFTISVPLAELIAQLKDYSKRLRVFQVKAEGEALFGPNKNIAVSLIKQNVELKQVHNNLVGITKSLGAVFDEPKFIGEGYRPHATIPVKSKLIEGQVVNLDSFTLVDMYPDNDINKRRLIQTFELAHI